MRMVPFSGPVRATPIALRGRPSRPLPLSAARIAPGRAPSRRVAGGYFPGSACSSNPSYSGSFYCSSQFGSVFGHRRPIYGGGTFVPIYWGSPLGYETETEAQPTVPEPESSLAGQVQALTDEVELLRQEQESRLEPRAYAPAPKQANVPPEAVVERRPATTFVYRNGQQLEAQNYAILGKTLWVFGEQSTKKIPLADLDLNATQKKNEDRGVEFVPPSGE
jgi:hypothetical protein